MPASTANSPAPGRALAVAAAALAVIGVFVAGYLAVVNLQGDTGVCVGVHGCHSVQSSKYGKLLGIPVSVPGLLLYAALLVLALGWRANWRGRAAEIALLGFVGALTGLLGSAYFTFLEAFVLDAWCSYCIVSALLMTALFLLWTQILRLSLR